MADFPAQGTKPWKAQLEEAIGELIDERIAAALADLPGGGDLAARFANLDAATVGQTLLYDDQVEAFAPADLPEGAGSGGGGANGGLLLTKQFKPSDYSNNTLDLGEAIPAGACVVVCTANRSPYSGHESRPSNVTGGGALWTQPGNATNASIWVGEGFSGQTIQFSPASDSEQPCFAVYVLSSGAFKTGSQYGAYNSQTIPLVADDDGNDVAIGLLHNCFGMQDAHSGDTPKPWSTVLTTNDQNASMYTAILTGASSNVQRGVTANSCETALGIVIAR